MDSEFPDSYDLNFSNRPMRMLMPAGVTRAQSMDRLPPMPITMQPVARHHAEGGVPEPAGFSISKCNKSGRV